MEEAISSLKEGMCAVYPTSTQPALGCLPNSKSLDLLYSLKKRRRDQPVSLGVANLEQAGQIAHIPEGVKDMIQYFPRGSITIVLDSKETLDNRLGGDRVAVRLVSHKVAVRLIEEVGPLTATSANISGKSPLGNPSLAAKSLSTEDTKVPFVNGICGRGAPSTLISWHSSTCSPDATVTKVLREGLVDEMEVFDWLKNRI